MGQVVTQEVVRQIPRVMTQEVVRQVPKIMVQEVVKQIAAPAPVVVQQAPIMQAPIIETFAPAPIMAAPMIETFASAPIMSSPIVGGAYGASYGAPIVETFGSGFAPSLATAPLVGSISAALPMTTMGAPVGAFGSPLVGTSYGLPPTVF